jgi:hypothetical protein
MVPTAVCIGLVTGDGHLTRASQQDESDPIETTFELNETLYAKASVPATDEVYLWLGVRYTTRPMAKGVCFG